MTEFKIYYTTLVGHVHLRVFANNTKCGELIMTIDEFSDYMTLRQSARGLVTFIKQAKKGEENE